MEGLSCNDLNNDVHQLALILYPPELFNEKFLIKIRDCVLKLSDEHVVKKWLNWISRSTARLTTGEEEKLKFLEEVLSSQFNLITDIKMRNRIINVMSEIRTEGLPESLLKSYLYLILGNVGRSDRILREIINRPPFENWTTSSDRNLYSTFALKSSAAILRKLARHPSDRTSLDLLLSYFRHYYNDTELKEISSSLLTGSLDKKLGLEYVEGISPHLVRYLRIEEMNQDQRLSILGDKNKFNLEEHSLWFWPFLDTAVPLKDWLYPELLKLEAQYPLWFIYVMDHERLVDFYNKKSQKSFLLGRRKLLRSKLEDRKTFMLSLYKLIELGDIDSTLISDTLKYVTESGL